MTAVAEPRTVDEVTAVFSSLLGDLLGTDPVDPDADVFADLGADSMVMARFCAKVRKTPGLPAVGVKAVYEHASLAALARALTPTDDDVRGTAPAPAQRAPEPHLASRTAYALTGLAQAAIFLAYSLLLGWLTTWGLTVIAGGAGVVEVYLRAVLVGAGGFVLVCTLPIAAKWLLVGRWQETSIPAWSPAYLRFWVVRTLVRSNPLALLFVGTPLLPLYLRALGARVGPGVTILTRSLPVCTDLLQIGAGSVVGKDSFLSCYRAHAGRIETGRVTLGAGVFVGEKTVLDIGSSMGDGAQIGHASSLQQGQSVAPGAHAHGSPAVPTTVDHRRAPEEPVARRTRAAYGVAVVARLLLVLLPVSLGGGYLVVAAVPAVAELAAAEATAAIGIGRFLLDAVVLSAVVFVGSTATGLVLALLVPRVAQRVLRTGVDYSLHGPRYGLHRTVVRLTNLKFFTHMFGDSSYVVGYLRAIGWQLTSVEQTGSNFGTEVGHETPWLSGVGRGTMVADGLSMMNAEYSSTSFRLAPVMIGAGNFLGNNIAYPAGGRTGADCLLATKVLVPLDGPVREGVGLLGSPAFEIPRSVARDGRFDHLAEGAEGRRRLAAKNRHNLRSMGLFLLVRWGQVLLLTVLGLAAVVAHGTLAEVAVSAFLAAGVVLTAAYYVLVERLLLRFRPLRPQYCSIYDPHFWWHERHWKLPSTLHLAAFDGTPFKSLIWRALGVRIGSRVLDDGCFMTERTLTVVGDGATLAQGSKLQCHSQEDGTFKSGVTQVGAGATLGVAAFVHYGITVGDGALVAADSFLMKGSEVAPGAVWAGNPAREV